MNCRCFWLLLPCRSSCCCYCWHCFFLLCDCCFPTNSVFNYQDVDWEETIYLNLIIHQLHYTMTLAVCSRTSPKNLQVLRRFSQKVYATPSRRRQQESKADAEEMTYPYLSFNVDNYEDMFKEVGGKNIEDRVTFL